MPKVINRISGHKDISKMLPKKFVHCTTLLDLTLKVLKWLKIVYII